MVESALPRSSNAATAAAMAAHPNPPRFASGESKLGFRREKTRRIAPWTWIVLAFLPEGYPSSVSSDYLAFQTWDTLQGLSTYIRSMLSTQALLSGIGVGAATATAIGATFQWFLRDLTGMVGGIVFTLYQGSNLDNRAKQWRLAADFMNDIAGVAGGATRAALTQHFARKQNAADVSAKEGSQETAATLVGMIVGMFLARLTANNIFLMWTSFMSLTAFHMYANYKAVCALCLTSINAERMAIVLQSFLKDGKAPSPEEASAQESALPRPFTSRSGIIFGAKISSLCGDGRKVSTSLPKKFHPGGSTPHSNVQGLLACLHSRSSSQAQERGRRSVLQMDGREL
ncbi:hypothetical protein SELMODRAFT_402795 [Selaginella moellendorffii]|uniref:Protein root UVB sensitive/RUS domain-containing protein n=1 Tax=Selaginella moellendorffii TaxID=88036 RepID=D8QN29_SELML|nr:hypothetical protein SELMODRAFT_402795 [Selaginella moellendorffii]